MNLSETSEQVNIQTDMEWHNTQQEFQALIDQMKQISFDDTVGPNYMKCFDFVNLTYETYNVTPDSHPTPLRLGRDTHKMQIWEYKRFTLIYSYNADKLFVSFKPMPITKVDPRKDVTKMEVQELMTYVIQNMFGEYVNDDDPCEYSDE